VEFEHSLQSYDDGQSESNEAHQNGDGEGADAYDDDVFQEVNSDGEDNYGIEEEGEPVEEDHEPAAEEGDGELEQNENV
jgi:hypothetical protein